MIKLRPSVHFAPLANGVFFKNWDESFRLAGHPAIYPIFERFLPHLERGVDRQALVGGVPENARPVVGMMLDQLTEHGMILDLSDSPGGAIAFPEGEACAQTIAYLEGVADDPWTAFRDLRAARIALIGSGPALLAAARAIGAMQVGELVCWAPREAAVAIADCLAEQPLVAADVRAAAEVQATQWGRDWTLVVHVHDHYDDRDDDHIVADNLDRIRRRTSAPLLEAVIGAELGVVGPLHGAKVDDALARVRTRAGADGARIQRSPLLAALVGNVAALEAVKIVAGLRSPTQRGSCALVTGSPLTSSFHPVEARGPNTAAAADAAYALAEIRDRPALTTSALVEQLQTIADEDTGLIDLPHPDELPQLPLFTQPGVAAEHAVIGYAGELEQAYARAGLEALRRLAESRAPARVTALSIEGDARGNINTERTRPTAASGWDAWLARGLLAHLADGLAGGDPPLEAATAGLGAERIQGSGAQARLHLKTLTARFGRSVDVEHVTIPSLPGVHFAVVRDPDRDEVTGLGAAFECETAIERGLEEAVARAQLADAGTALPARGPLAPLATDNRPAAVRQASGTLDALLARLTELGLEVLVHPWCGEPGLQRRGIFVGWVTINAR